MQSKILSREQIYVVCFKFNLIKELVFHFINTFYLISNDNNKTKQNDLLDI